MSVGMCVRTTDSAGMCERAGAPASGAINRLACTCSARLAEPYCLSIGARREGTVIDEHHRVDRCGPSICYMYGNTKYLERCYERV